MVGSALYLAAQTDPPGRVGRLNYMDGPVSFQPAGIDDWVDLSLNRPLTTGDNIWVGDRARAELHVGSTALRFGAKSSFEFLNLDDQTTQIRLSEGTLSIRVRNLAQDEVVEIDTPNLAFTILRPGEYRIDANPDAETTTITVRDGEGDVTAGSEGFPLGTRQRVFVKGSDQVTYNLAAAGGPDEFDQWCSSRDRREDQSQSARYVSREVAGYEDLDQYGRWENQPDYGDVWIPTSVSAGWAPYRDGYWAWVAPWGWTWVDEAPWGFAPYHYGRWAYFGTRWGWVPGPRGIAPVYAPALVAWVGGSRGGMSISIGAGPAVGWFPLGPREPYFPSYQVSQRYFTRVNNTNTVINSVTINNYYSSRNSNNTSIRYANRDVRNGVTAVPQDSFGRGRRVNQDARSIPAAQLSSAQVFGAPAIAPQRESLLGPRADTAGRAGRPPANVLNRPVVARRAPPAASVPFARQQQELGQNPGRPLPSSAIQRDTSNAGSRIRVVDMGRIRRVQPMPGGGQQAVVPQQNSVPQPAGSERRNGPPTRQQQPQQQMAQPPAAVPQAPITEQRNRPDRQPRQQQMAQPPVVTPQAPVTEQRNRPDRQPRQQQMAQPPVPTPQAPVTEQRNRPERQPRQEPTAQPPVVTPQPPAAEQRNRPERQPRQQQQAQPSVATPQPPVTEQRNRPPERQRQEQVAQPKAENPQPEPRQRQGNERQQKRREEDQKKSDK